MLWMIWKTAEPQTTKMNRPRSQGPTGDLLAFLSFQKKTIIAVTCRIMTSFSQNDRHIKQLCIELWFRFLILADQLQISKKLILKSKRKIYFLVIDVRINNNFFLILESILKFISRNFLDFSCILKRDYPTKCSKNQKPKKKLFFWY